MISQEDFLQLPTAEVARLVRAAGPQVCVFPINGTRRWFMLEHGHEVQDNLAQAYLNALEKRSIEICQMFFLHGLDTLITPIFGGELLNRGDEYIQMAIDGMTNMAIHPDFLSFYEEYKVRVHFYGDYPKQLAGTPFAYLIDLFDRITKLTAKNDQHRLFYGVFANDATEAIGEFTVRHFQKAGDLPLRKELIEQYYGEYVEPATLVIGFDKFSVFDYPLLGLGEEHLYFTVAPSPYFSSRQLRSILYDHIYLRCAEEQEYARLSEQDILMMKKFYLANCENTQGIGTLHDGIWYPRSQVLEYEEIS